MARALYAAAALLLALGLAASPGDLAAAQVQGGMPQVFTFSALKLEGGAVLTEAHVVLRPIHSL